MFVPIHWHKYTYYDINFVEKNLPMDIFMIESDFYTT